MSCNRLTRSLGKLVSLTSIKYRGQIIIKIKNRTKKYVNTERFYFSDHTLYMQLVIDYFLKTYVQEFRRVRVNGL